MKLAEFRLERFFDKYEFTAPFLLGCSDCQSFSAGEILRMDSRTPEQFQNLWLGYTDTQGSETLRKEIAKLYTKTGAEHILVHSGAEEAIFNFMNVTLEPGDHVIVQFPCYQSLFEIAGSIGCEVTKWQSSRRGFWEWDIYFIKKSVKSNTRAVILNFPHNPTGSLMEKGAFLELADLSRKKGFIIFSDEVYRLLEYNEKDRLPALCDIDSRGVSLGVMSKSFGLAGLRIGWIATHNKSLFKKLTAFKDYLTICNSAPSEFLATIALKNMDRIIGRNMNILRNNIEKLNAFFPKYQGIFKWTPPQAGPVAFPSIEYNTNADFFCHDLLMKAGVLLLPGTLYGNFKKNFRIGFGRIDLSQGLEKIDTYFQKIN